MSWLFKTSQINRGTDLGAKSRVTCFGGMFVLKQREMTDCSVSSEGGSLQLPVPFKRHVLGEVGKAGEAPGDCRDRS